jgi:hypothetical protein
MMRLPLMRLIALLLLVIQFGVIAHRVEHYLAPQHMECGEDACDAFSPSPDAVPLAAFVPPVFFIVFFLRFWTLRDCVPREPADRLGFRAQAPPFRSRTLAG